MAFRKKGQYHGNVGRRRPCPAHSAGLGLFLACMFVHTRDKKGKKRSLVASREDINLQLFAGDLMDRILPTHFYAQYSVCHASDWRYRGASLLLLVSAVSGSWLNLYDVLEKVCVCRVLRLRRNTHRHNYASFDSLLSGAGLGHLGKAWIVRGTTTRRLPYWANKLFYPSWNRSYRFTAYR